MLSFKSECDFWWLTYGMLVFLTQPPFYACPKPYIVIFFVFHDLRWEVIVRLVDIGGFVDLFNFFYQILTTFNRFKILSKLSLSNFLFKTICNTACCWLTCGMSFVFYRCFVSSINVLLIYCFASITEPFWALPSSQGNNKCLAFPLENFSQKLNHRKRARRVWRYQICNQNPYIKEEQTTQWPKEKGQKDKQWSTKHTHKTKDPVTRTPLKSGCELMCSGR